MPERYTRPDSHERVQAVERMRREQRQRARRAARGALPPVQRTRTAADYRVGALAVDLNLAAPVADRW